MLFDKLPVRTQVIQFHNRPALRLSIAGDVRYTFFFGVIKAKMILASIEKIREFIDVYDESKKTTIEMGG